MAMHANRGFCPNNGFTQEEMRGNTSYFWARTKELLGDRIGYMVYYENPKGNEHGYFVDVLTHAIGTLGIEVAAALKAMLPICNYSELGRPIILEDFDGVPDMILYGVSFEDSRYMIVLKDDDENIYVKTYKK